MIFLNQKNKDILDFHSVQNMYYKLDKILKKSQNKATYISSRQIRFNSNISFPIIFNKDIQFQIYCKHQFGYNPQEFNTILKGKINFKKGQTYKQTYILNEKGQKIATFSIKFRSNSIIEKKAQNIMPKNQKLIIRSIIAHLNNIKNTKIYININLGDQNKQTNIINTRNGQLVLTELYEIQKSSYIKEAIFQIYSIQSKNNQTKLICKGNLNLQDQFPKRKIDLYNLKNQLIGDLFIDSKRLIKNLPKDQKLNQLNKNFTTLDVNKPKQQQRSIQAIQKSIQPYRIDEYIKPSSSLKLFNANSKLSLNQLKYSTISNSLTRIKKINVFHNNNQIVFPKEKRFIDYKDKQSQIISYLQNKNGFQFKSVHSGRFYRGASFGIGQKTDFVLKGSPGVGRYKLPTIWDRY